MTTFTLTMVIAAVLVAALLSGTLVLGALLVWTGRRVGDAAEYRGELDAFRTQLKNLDDFLETYRKRDAQRASTVAQRTKKANGAAPPEETTEEEIPPHLKGLFHDL